MTLSILLMISIPVSFIAGYFLNYYLEKYKWRKIQEDYNIYFVNKEDEYTNAAIQGALIELALFGALDDLEPRKDKKDNHLKVVKEDKNGNKPLN